MHSSPFSSVFNGSLRKIILVRPSQNPEKTFLDPFFALQLWGIMYLTRI